jgi:hypothetical protein
MIKHSRVLPDGGCLRLRAANMLASFFCNNHVGRLTTRSVYKPLNPENFTVLGLTPYSNKIIDTRSVAFLSCFIFRTTSPPLTLLVLIVSAFQRHRRR